MIGSTDRRLPWVLMGRKEIKRPQDLKGKTIALSRPGGLTDQLAKAVMKKFNLTTQEVKLLHIGGTGQLEPYNAMVQGLTQATFSNAALGRARQARRLRLIYNLNELDVPVDLQFDVHEFQNAERAARSCAKIRRGIGGNDSFRRKKSR